MSGMHESLLIYLLFSPEYLELFFKGCLLVAQSIYSIYWGRWWSLEVIWRFTTYFCVMIEFWSWARPLFCDCISKSHQALANSKHRCCKTSGCAIKFTCRLYEQLQCLSLRNRTPMIGNSWLWTAGLAPTRYSGPEELDHSYISGSFNW